MPTIVCVGFQAGLDVSNNRAEIYKDAVDALLMRWDASRSIYRDRQYKAFTTKRREELLADLAARTFINDEIVVTEARAEEAIVDILSGMPVLSDHENRLDGKGVLNAIAVQHGLMEEKAKGLWAFAHLTFHEFFVAHYLVSRDVTLRAAIIGRFLSRPDWREVVMLTAALLPDADRFVLHILGAIIELGTECRFVLTQTIRSQVSRATDSMLDREKVSEAMLHEPTTLKERLAAQERTALLSDEHPLTFILPECVDDCMSQVDRMCNRLKYDSIEQKLRKLLRQGRNRKSEGIRWKQPPTRSRWARVRITRGTSCARSCGRSMRRAVDLRSSALVEGPARGRRGRQRKARHAPNAGGADPGQDPKAFQADDQQRTRRSDRAQCARPRLHRSGTESALGRRHDRVCDRRARQAVSGGDSRSVFPVRGRVGDQRSQRSAADAEGARDGGPAALP
jgi:hypothetical protein